MTYEGTPTRPGGLRVRWLFLGLARLAENELVDPRL